jgi:hypothetical protein
VGESKRKHRQRIVATAALAGCTFTRSTDIDHRKRCFVTTYNVTMPSGRTLTGFKSMNEAAEYAVKVLNGRKLDIRPTPVGGRLQELVADNDRVWRNN